MGVSIKICNENETYTLHFMFSYKYSTYQHFVDICNGKQYQNNISTFEETKNMIQDYFIKKNIQVYLIVSLMISESNRI